MTMPIAISPELDVMYSSLRIGYFDKQRRGVGARHGSCHGSTGHQGSADDRANLFHVELLLHIEASLPSRKLELFG
ncbi:MAG TPA: hypothetical protein VEZ16_06670 [Microvirga sp.]|nr:hypothetical protein [Microvirga sp.]